MFIAYIYFGTSRQKHSWLILSIFYTSKIGCILQQFLHIICIYEMLCFIVLTRLKGVSYHFFFPRETATHRNFPLLNFHKSTCQKSFYIMVYYSRSFYCQRNRSSKVIQSLQLHSRSIFLQTSWVESIIYSHFKKMRSQSNT